MWFICGLIGLDVAVLLLCLRLPVWLLCIGAMLY